jgi:peptidoglycan/LPS O-acetylase OafA/YrhL
MYNKNLQHFDYVDVLRGIAVLGVIAVHTCQYGSFQIAQKSINNLLGNGARGVQLFYLVSAFTLFLSMKNRKENEYHPVRNFYLRRFFRIAPMYYLGIIYYLWQDGFGSRYWLGDATHISIGNIISNMLFLHGFNPYWINSLVPGGWSVAVEMMFYGIFPFIFSKLKSVNQAIKIFIGSLIIRLVLQYVLSKYDPTESDYLWGSYLFLYFPSQFPVFILGIIMYFIVIEKQKISIITNEIWLILTILFLAQIATGINLFSRLFSRLLPSHIVFGIGFLFLGISLNKIGGYVGRVDLGGGGVGR